jgi:hypothetical protein
VSGGRIALLVAGIIAGLAGLAFLVGGIALIAVNETERDADGFFSTAQEPYASDSHAIVSDTLDIGTDGPDWLFEEGRLATLRLQGGSEDPEREIFLGVAPTAQVEDYLAGVSFDEVTDVELDPFRATYEATSGSESPREPGSEDFWAASATGSGEQTLEWEVAEGDWSAVVMNADATPGVEARLSLGAKVGFIFWLGLGLVIAGAVILAGAGVMAYFSLRRPRSTSAAATPAGAS